MLRLDEDGLFPSQFQPSKVVKYSLYKLRPGARHIDVLDAHQEAPAEPARHAQADQRRKRVSQMQLAIRARRKT